MSNPADTNPVPTPGKSDLDKETDRLLGALKKIVSIEDPKVQAQRFNDFRNSLIAARTVVAKFNSTLEVLRSFRGEDFLPGVEPIVLRKTGDNKGGGKPLSEAERMKRLLG